MTHALCSSGYVSGGYFYSSLVTIPIFITIQSAILFHTIRHQIQNQTNRQIVSARVCYIVLQICGLYWTICDLFRYVIDCSFSILQSNIGCDVVAFSVKLITPSIFYSTYLFAILQRMESSFTGSILALSTRTVWISKALIGCILIGPFIFCGTFIWNQGKGTCIAEWRPLDLQNRALLYCELIPVSSLRSYVRPRSKREHSLRF